MLSNHLIDNLILWADANTASLYWTLAVLILYLLVTRFTLPKIERSVDQGRFKSEAAQKAYHTMRVLTGFITSALILFSWGFDFSGLLVISTSLLTLTGVALFASWSLLSNITSYFVLLFHTSFRRGNFIRIIDIDNYMEGYIADISLFNTKLITEEREVILYPNNLLLVRPSLINPRRRMSTMGKITDPKPESVKAEDAKVTEHRTP